MSSHTDFAAARGPAFETDSSSDAFDLLADERRRAALSVLADRGEPVDLSELAREVVDLTEDGLAGPSPDAVDRMRVALHHQHLPKIADAGLIAYDIDRKAVYPTDVPETFE